MVPFKSSRRFEQGKVFDAAPFDAFREVWNLNDWNQFRVRCIGAEPVISIWINGLKMATVTTADPGLAGYDQSQIRRRAGTKGHIGLEVHSNGPDPGWHQWGVGTVSRWKNLRVREVIG